MRKIFRIAWLYIYTTYKDRSTLIFSLALPIIFTLVIGVGSKGFASQPTSSQTTYRVDAINQDGGDLGGRIIEDLQSNPILDIQITDESPAETDLKAGDAVAVLVLPEDLTARVAAGEKVSLEFRLKLEEPVASQIVEQAVQAALADVSSGIDIAETSLRVADRLKLFDQKGAPTRDGFYQSALNAGLAAWQTGRPVSVKTSQVTHREEPKNDIPIGFRQSSPGIAVMFTMFFLVGGGGAILLEREQGTLRRLLTAPVSKRAVLTGKLLGVFIAGSIQFLILVAVGQFFFGVDWGHDILALLVIALSFTFSITGLGMLMAALVRTYAQVDALSTLIVLPMSGLGGAMWPLEIVPAWMQKVAMFLPTGWAMQGFQDIITRGLGLQAVLPEAGVLMLFGIAFMAIGVWRFKYE